MSTLHRLISVALILGGCAQLPPLPPPAPPLPVPSSAFQEFKSAYVIGSEDIINIVVYGHVDLSAQAAIAADGAFAYPLLGRVPAAGLSTKELETQLAKSLSEYVVNPQVSVTVVQFLSQQVYVLGEVRAPGPQNLVHAATLVEILAKAGGPTSEAGGEVIIVRAARDKSGTSTPTEGTESGTTIRVEIERLMVGEISRPIQVASGDTIYVPRIAFYYISGEINRPGRYRLERDTTVAKALTVAGGPTRFAATSRLKIQRVVAGERLEFHARLNDVLQAEDVLIIPQSVF